MKFSFYNFLFQYKNIDYIYNSFSTSIAQLDSLTFSAIKNNDISILSVDVVKDMMSSGFIVDEKEDEYEKFLLFYNNIKYAKTASNFSLTFIPTYNCNLACPYCMQGLNKKKAAIKHDDMDKIVLFLEKEFNKANENGTPINNLHISLFGGEPTLEKKALIYFCDIIGEFTRKHNVKVSFSMTSNFTLVDDDLIDLIKKYHILTQVSIDGTEEQHNKRRITRNGNGTYAQIINNLKKIKENQLENYIVIRLNIDKNNLTDAEKILTAVENYSTDVYFGFLDHFEGKNDFYSECLDRSKHSRSIAMYLENISIKHNFFTNAHFGKQAPCSINCVNKFFVDYKLDLYKCEMLLNNNDMKVGHIDNDGSFIPTAAYYNQMSISPEKYQKCRTCKLLPMCAGGCAGKSYYKYSNGSGKIEKCLCAYTEKDLLTYLKLYIDNAKIK